MVELTHRNTRRYGGYIVHMGIVLMFIGFTGAAFNQDTTQEVKVGDSFDIWASTELRVADIRDGDNANYYLAPRGGERRCENGETIGVLEPERRLYKSSGQPTSEVAIRRRLNEDLYLNFAGMSETDSSKAIIQAYVFPLVSWIWIGFWVLFFGTLVCLVPSKMKMQYPKTQVVGMVEKHAAVQK